MREEADLILDYGTVDGSRQAANTKNVLMDVNGIGDGVERATNMEEWGNAAVMLRPMPPSGGKSFEVIFTRHGSQLLPIASREVRWQIDLEPGEVVLRSLTETPARIYLKPDGSVVVEASSIKLGSADASEGIPKGTSLKDWLDNHTHGYIDDTAGNQLTTPPVSVYTALVTTPNPSPEPSSKVKVE